MEILIHKNITTQFENLLNVAKDIDEVLSDEEKEFLKNNVLKEFKFTEQETKKNNFAVAFNYFEDGINKDGGELTDTKRTCDSFLQFVKDHKSDLAGNDMNFCINFVRELASAYFDADNNGKEYLGNLVIDLEKLGDIN